MCVIEGARLYVLECIRMCVLEWVKMCKCVLEYMCDRMCMLECVCMQRYMLECIACGRVLAYVYKYRSVYGSTCVCILVCVFFHSHCAVSMKYKDG